jgi:prepilin-type processing-associated H-X9-DG protein
VADVTDGLSTTAAVAERLIVRASDPADFTGVLSGPVSTQSFCAGSTGSTRTLDRWVTYCNSVTYPDPAWSVYHGRAWISGWGHAAGTYMHVMPMNRRNCHLYGGEDDGNTLVTPSSRHSGGINVLLGDGSVRFVKEAVGMPVWWALGSRNGGEVSSASDL